MKPFKTFLFFIWVFTLLGILIFSFPGKEFHITDNIRITFPTIQDFFTEEKVEYVDIEDIIKVDTSNYILQIDTIEIQVDTIMAFDSLSGMDSVLILDTIVSIDTTVIFSDSLKQLVVKLQYPNDDKSILYPIFKALKDLENKNKLIRILHYGDSQIEGDRMTAMIRHRMQSKFGGSGIGFLPVKGLHNFSVTVNRRNSDNWQRYSIIGKSKSVEHKKYGLMTNYSRFTPLIYNAEDTIIHEAWLRVSKSKYAFESSKHHRQCKIYYGYNKEDAEVGLFYGSRLVKFNTLYASNRVNMMRFSMNSSPYSIKLKFSGKDSPDIYGIALDAWHGVAVDNIALRGSSGLEFTKLDRTHLKQMYDILDVKLFILQFGVNVVPNVQNNYDYYEKWYYKQLIALQKLVPDASIIVISLSDMSHKKNGQYESYSNVKLIRDAQKNAAFKANCAFWDMYEAMGGENSMPSWVFAEPSLAQKDFIHFNQEGADIMAQMFYNAFILEYNDWEER